MSTYEVSQKGSDFIDETARHWENPGVSKDDVWDWLWEIRETGDFEGSARRFIKKVGKEGAERVLNWAHSHGYLVEVEGETLYSGQNWCEECQDWFKPGHSKQHANYEHWLATRKRK